MARPWKLFLKDLQFIENKYKLVNCDETITLDEYLEHVNDSISPEEKKESENLVQFSKWVKKKGTNEIVNISDASTLSSNISDNIRIQPTRKKAPKQYVQSMRGSSPIKITYSELEGWLKNKSSVVTQTSRIDETGKNDEFNNTMEYEETNPIKKSKLLSKEDNDILSRVSSLEKHLCELIQLNKALIETKEIDVGIPMPEIKVPPHGSSLESAILSDTPSFHTKVPWLENYTNKISLNLDVLPKYNEEEHNDYITVVPSTPVKGDGYLSRTSDGLFFTPKTNPKSKYIIQSYLTPEADSLPYSHRGRTNNFIDSGNLEYEIKPM